MNIYQIALRTFTPDGTLKAAESLLPHVASLGVDIVYVCPFYVAENDENRDTWSVRQKASNTNNPKNPYKIADYFNVDPEYGTNQDLKDFVKTAHKLGLSVMFDLVYLHCARAAVFFQEHPDFVELNEDGTVKVPDLWPFARLNFANQDMRKYLLSNMETLMTEYGADGFRCDVGDAVPLDFWRDSFAYLKKKNPDLITLNEGANPEYIKEVFDWGYDFEWIWLMIDIFAREKSAAALKERYLEEQRIYGENVCRLIRSIENHDTASDCGLDRNEIIMTSKGVEAAMVITNTFEGIPFMWNGYEFADNAENNMFSNRFYGRRSAMNWSRAFTEEGIRRMAFVKKINELYHTCEALHDGKLTWLSNSAEDKVVSYLKTCGEQKILVAVNTKNVPVTAEIAYDGKTAEVLLASDQAMEDGQFVFGPYGYCIIKQA